MFRLIISKLGNDAFKYLFSNFENVYFPFFILSNVSTEGTAVIKFIGIFSNNLDEFYKVRYATVKRIALSAKKQKKRYFLNTLICDIGPI